MIAKSGCRFPACAKPRQPLGVSFDASAGEARSEKIMLKQQAKAKYRFNSKIHFALSADCSHAGQPTFGGGAVGRCAAFTTPACVSAAAICCMRLMRSTAATGGKTKRQAG